MLNNIKDKYIILILFFLAVSVRFFPFFEELPPYLFCDEGIYFGEALRLLQDKSFIVKEFRAGGGNILPIAMIGMFAPDIYINNPTLMLLTGRFFLTIMLGSLTVYYIYKITFLLSGNKSVSFLASLFFIMSPYVYSVGRYWYPDHYIYFFSAGLLFYLLRSVKSVNSRDFVLMGFFYACTVSVKYTGLLLILPIALCFIFLIIECHRKKNNYSNVLCKCFFSFSISVFFVLIFFNFGIFSNFDLFIKDFKFNINNYAGYESGLDGVIYYFSVFYFMLFGVFFVPIVFIGYYYILKNNYKYFVFFMVFPLFFMFYLGSKGLVLHRNLSILIPFFFPVIAIGFYFLYQYCKNKIKLKFTFYLYSIFAFSFVVYQVLFSINNDLKEDSRVVAYDWIKYNVPNGSDIGVNEFCSGLSPAKQGENKIYYDPDFFGGFDYYVINTYWNSYFASSYQYKNGLLFNFDQKYIHFNDFNNRSVFALPSYKNNYDDLESYKLIKKIQGNGPEILIFKDYSIEGDEYKFGRSKSKTFKSIRGISTFEPGGRWSDGREVIFEYYKVFPKKFILKLRIVDGFGENNGAIATLSVGDWSGEFVISKNASIEFDVENNSLSNEIKIIIPFPAKPSDLGVSSDSRELGIRFSYIEVVEVE